MPAFAYLDASALLKLIVHERETSFLDQQAAAARACGLKVRQPGRPEDV
jgi:predicted nucleic acid-binding protein